MLSISNDFADSATRITSLGAGNPMTPTRIVVHYTAGSSLSGAVNALKSRGLSYNVLVDLDGSLHQARAFNRRAGHAGRSNFKATSGLKNQSSLNGSTIAISLVNLGFHEHFSGGHWWYARSKGKLRGPKVVDVEANKMSSIYNPGLVMHWVPYTDAQVASCEALIEALVAKYPSITEIVGHDDVSINAKLDPGPALPTQAWREKFNMQGDLGLEAAVNSPDGTLNMRDRPAYLGGRVVKVLSQGDKVHIRSVAYSSGRSSAALINSSGRALTGWASVDVQGDNKHHGFVYMGYLTKTPLHADYARKLLEGAAVF
ncbi:N-acetylmuramoyl-L-alanine amidase [Roseobacter denitrificans]|nr:N-acetylmuramoyl-L-alanine amidase [Roseobacter denitrificans]SFG04008.1 N-acetylmuramoyl-L-alanine amidase [Roseobacter denitrificans OCh 114]